MLKRSLAILLAAVITLAGCAPAQPGQPDSATTAPSGEGAVVASPSGGEGAVSASPSAPAAQPAAGGLTPEQKLGDLNLLCSQLEKKHKNLYAKVTQEQFAEQKASIAEKIPTLSDTEFYLELTRLVALVGDAHTSMGYRDAIYDHFRALPFAVLKLEGGWHLAMAEKTQEQYLGQLVTAINDTPIEEVYTRASTIVSHENTAWMDSNFSNAINFADPLKFLGVIPDLDGVTLHLKDPKTGTEQAVTVPSMSKDEIMSAEIVSLRPQAQAPTAPQRGNLYRALPIDETAYLIQYNSCQEDANNPMKAFVQQVEADLTAKSYSKVLVDLRYNSGGNSAILNPMTKKLAELQKKQGFKLYTMIGPDTFSSGIINSIDLQNIGSTLVGSQTGGNVNGYGELQSFDLQNLPATVWYSTKYFELVPGYAKDSLYPDIPVTRTLEELLAGTDCEVEAILAL